LFHVTFICVLIRQNGETVQFYFILFNAILLQCYCNALAFKAPFFFGIFMVNKKINDKSECEHFYQLNRQFKW